jgi:hypothetical protein
MKLIPLTVDARPYHGYKTIYVNPEDVAWIEPSGSPDNPTAIWLRTGARLCVMGSPEENTTKLLS